MGAELEVPVATVVNRVRGQKLAVPTADTADLAAYLADLAEIRRALIEEEALVHVELLKRLDRRGKWTWMVDDEGGSYKLTAPSPTAGTTGYAKDLLRAELCDLLAAELIDPEAAREALRRTVTVTMLVDVDASLDGLKDAAARTTGIGGVKVHDVAVACGEQIVVSGVNRLLKIGGDVAEAVERAQGPVPQPQRRVRVDARMRP